MVPLPCCWSSLIVVPCVEVCGVAPVAVCGPGDGGAEGVAFGGDGAGDSRCQCVDLGFEAGSGGFAGLERVGQLTGLPVVGPFESLKFL